VSTVELKQQRGKPGRFKQVVSKLKGKKDKEKPYIPLGRLSAISLHTYKEKPYIPLGRLSAISLHTYKEKPYIPLGRLSAISLHTYKVCISV